MGGFKRKVINLDSQAVGAIQHSETARSKSSQLIAVMSAEIMITSDKGVN